MSRKPDPTSDSPGSHETTSGVDRRRFLKSSAAGVAAVSGVALAGCSEDGGGGGGENSIAIISSPAGFDDSAFNDNAVEGVEAAQEEYDINLETVEVTEVSQYESTQADLAETGEHDLIICVSYNQTEALQQNAPEYPDQNWMLINAAIDEDNVSGWVEANNEMSFLTGVLAGTLTTEDLDHAGGSTDPDTARVGFVGGEDEDLINAFEQSYIQGVEWVNDDVQVDTGYIGNYEDTSTASDIASSQYDNGADIVYHAAAAAGIGVFDAAQDEERYAIGVDSDQSRSAPDYSDVIVGSGVKFLNTATERVSVAVVEDNFEEYAGENNLTIENDGIDLVIGQDFEGELPDVVDQNVQDAKDAIVNGDVELECGFASCN